MSLLLAKLASVPSRGDKKVISNFLIEGVRDVEEICLLDRRFGFSRWRGG